MNSQLAPVLSIVVPCYNEEAVLPESIKRLVALLDRLTSSARVADGSHVIFVDDGSSDSTWSVIRAYHVDDKRIRGIKLSANRGHQLALMAGLFAAEGSATVSIDADLQDDIDVIESMLSAFRAGADIVYGVRRRRESDSGFKRLSAESYYRLLRWFGVKVVFNHADYRLLSRRALDALKQFPEANLFLRGIVPLIGFRSDIVYYDRDARFAGASKYSLRRMLALAVDGVTSFTAVPLRLISMLGLVVSIGSIAMIVWALWTKLFTSNAVPGWASSVIPIYFLGGVQLLSIGVLGEYVAKIYLETKRRPRYFIEEQI